MQVKFSGKIQDGSTPLAWERQGLRSICKAFLYKKYKKYIDDDDIDTDAIGNLVLLDSKTNRSYKNSVFALKKDYIFKSKDFIPPLTICAFMRVRVPDKNSEDVEISSYVSQDVKWNNSDCELNKNNIINSIKNLLSDGKSK